MPPPIIIPAYQPVPLPAPLWLLQVLIVLGFFLHALPMNVIWVGGPVAACLMWFNRYQPTSLAYRGGKRLAYSLPVFLSFAITQGIVPLLFLQLLYGPAFYTSSVLMAWLWLAVLGILLLGYYLAYIFKLKQATWGARSVWLLWLVFLLFGGVAFLFVNNMTLMLHPERWPSMARGGVDGLSLNLGDAQLLPRYLHFFTGAFAVMGMVMGSFGIYYDHKDKPFSVWWIRSGAGLFVVGTLAAVMTGAWFLLSLPKPMMMAYMGHDRLATAAFGGSFGLSLLALLSAVIACTSGSLRAMQITIGTGLLSVLGMVIMRHMLRVLTLHPLLRPEELPVHTQWDLLIVFVISVILLAFYLTWLSKVAFTAFEAKTEPADSAVPS